MLETTATAGAISRAVNAIRLRSIVLAAIRIVPLVLQVDLAAPFHKKRQTAKPLHPDPVGPATPNDPDDQHNAEFIGAITNPVLTGQDDTALTIFKLESEQHLQKHQ
jgi:hypothetical protein